ncbi:unnamed protein product [Mytilus edulis]|uniref:Uncharacterized protein n=1 Tax=Mytilus edulis TaxID=6550 RepID=A0A8S3RG71_MYTED|nr:unnamed protein product [Mytilus edulis]
MTTYFNNTLSGIEKNFSDTTETSVKRAKKAENTFKFKGNQVQFEINSDIQVSARQIVTLRRIDLKRHPFEGAWLPAAKVSATKIASRPQTSATTVACKGTGQEQDLPEDLLLKDQNSEIFKVQDSDIFQTFYEYENCNSDIYVKGRLKKIY